MIEDRLIVAVEIPSGTGPQVDMVVEGCALLESICGKIMPAVSFGKSSQIADISAAVSQTVIPWLKTSSALGNELFDNVAAWATVFSECDLLAAAVGHNRIGLENESSMSQDGLYNYWIGDPATNWTNLAAGLAQKNPTLDYIFFPTAADFGVSFSNQYAALLSSIGQTQITYEVYKPNYLDTWNAVFSGHRAAWPKPGIPILYHRPWDVDWAWSLEDIPSAFAAAKNLANIARTDIIVYFGQTNFIADVQDFVQYWRNYVADYVTVNEANTYFSARLKTQPWDSASSTDRSKAISQATKIIDNLNFLGDKTDEVQVNEFPRNGDTTVPTAIKDACCEIVLALLDDRDLEMDYENLRTKFEKYDGVTEGYTGDLPFHTVAGVPSIAAWRYLTPYLRNPLEIQLERLS